MSCRPAIQSGLGGAILNFNQYYSLDPSALWATNIIAAALGIVFFLLVVLAERLVVRRAPEQHRMTGAGAVSHPQTSRRPSPSGRHVTALHEVDARPRSRASSSR